MNVTRFTNGLPEKVIFGSKQMILVLKMACSYNFRSALNIFLTFCSIKGAKRYKKIIFENNFRSAPRIFFFFFFLKVCTVKGTKRYMQLVLMVFLKKFSFGANGLF